MLISTLLYYKKYTEKGEIMADCNREHEYRLDKADERLDKLTDCLNGVTAYWSSDLARKT